VSLARLHWTAVFWGTPTLQRASVSLSKKPTALSNWILARRGICGPGARRTSTRTTEPNGNQSARSFRSLAGFRSGLLCSRLLLHRSWASRPECQCVSACARMDPNLVRRELAIAYRYQVDLDRAEARARDALKLHPNDLPGEVILARIWRRAANLRKQTRSPALFRAVRLLTRPSKAS